jgi:hypothetical protein
MSKSGANVCRVVVSVEPTSVMCVCVCVSADVCIAIEKEGQGSGADLRGSELVSRSSDDNKCRRGELIHCDLILQTVG